jgi:hypothetical protein
MLDSIGLTNAYTAEERSAASRCYLSTIVAKEWALMDCFPNLSVIIDDWETGNLDNPYEELTLQFAAASRGAFQPTDIVDNFNQNWQKEKTEYGFTLNGTKYRTELTMMRDWLDPKFIDLIAEALEDQQINGQFFSYRGVGNIFLTEEQYSFLLERMPDFFKPY